MCKIAQAIGVEIKENDIEISHRIGRKRGDKPVLAKFVSHKVKSRIYKARTNLKAGVKRYGRRYIAEALFQLIY